MYYKIINTIKEYEEDLRYDIEAPSHHYLLNFVNGKVLIFVVNVYYEDGDNWGEIETISNSSKIDEIKISIEDYLKFVIRFYDDLIEYEKYEYPSENWILKKIEIMRLV